MRSDVPAYMNQVTFSSEHFSTNHLSECLQLKLLAHNVLPLPFLPSPSSPSLPPSPSSRSLLPSPSSLLPRLVLIQGPLHYSNCSCCQCVCRCCHGCSADVCYSCATETPLEEAHKQMQECFRGCELSSHAAPMSSNTFLFPFQQDTAYYIESGVHKLVMEYPPGDDRMPVVMCNVKSNPPNARQQWYIVNMTGGRCLIRSKVDGKVLTCKDNTVTVCDQHNDDNTQLWRWDMNADANGPIFSVSSGQVVGMLKANKQLSLYEWGDKVPEEAGTKCKYVE